MQIVYDYTSMIQVSKTQQQTGQELTEGEKRFNQLGEQILAACDGTLEIEIRQIVENNLRSYRALAAESNQLAVGIQRAATDMREAEERAKAALRNIAK